MKNMKKLMMLVLGGCLLFSLAMPVLAQDAGTQTQPAPNAEKKDTNAQVKDTKAEGTKAEGTSTKTVVKKTKATKTTKAKTTKANTTDAKKTEDTTKQ